MNEKLPYTAEDFVIKYVAAMNAWDVELCCMHYEDTASLVDTDGSVVYGIDEIRKIIISFLDAKPIMKGDTGLLVVNGDVALHRSNWTGSFLNESGERFETAGTGTEIIRQGKDGVWKHCIDIPDPTGLKYT
jgi:ketosteroid isomerase-like protein